MSATSSGAERALGDALLQGRSVDQLHDEEGEGLALRADVRADVVQRDEAGVREAGQDARLVREAADLVVLRALEREDLERDRTAEAVVGAPEDVAHAAAAEVALEAEAVAEGGADEHGGVHHRPILLGRAAPRPVAAPRPRRSPSTSSPWHDARSAVGPAHPGRT